jgi:hypothetical protein
MKKTNHEDDAVEVDTCKAALFYVCNFKLDSDGFVLLAFQRLAIFLYPTIFGAWRFYPLPTKCN